MRPITVDQHHVSFDLGRKIDVVQEGNQVGVEIPVIGEPSLVSWDQAGEHLQPPVLDRRAGNGSS